MHSLLLQVVGGSAARSSAGRNALWLAASSAFSTSLIDM